MNHTSAASESALIDYDRLLGQNAIGERTLCVFLGPYAMVANAAE